VATGDGAAVPVEVVEDTRATFTEYMSGLSLKAEAGNTAVEADAELKKAKAHVKADAFQVEPGFEGTGKKGKKGKKSAFAKKFVDPSLVGVTIGEDSYRPRERGDRPERRGDRGDRGERSERGGRGADARRGGKGGPAPRTRAPRQQLSAAAFPALRPSK
jgi:hypothetical protein